MAAGDEKPSDEGVEQSPASRTPDLRVGSHADMGVNVSRDLRNTGGNARGHGANFSKLSFSSRGLPREEVAEKDPAPVRPVASAPVPSPVPTAPPTPPDASDKDGVVSWLTGLFTRR
ncbi:MAG: hypothetical protein ABI446_01175 [Gemmatimonadaceae bacterium]